MHTRISSSLRWGITWSCWRRLPASSRTRSSSKRGAWASLRRSFRPGSTSSPRSWPGKSPPGRSERRPRSRKRANSAVTSMPRAASSRHYKSSSMRSARPNTFDLRTKGGNSRQESSVSGILPESLTTRSFLMYRLRQMDVDDKVCEQVDMTLLAQVYPKEAIERCVGQSQPWASKARRMRQSTLLALVLLVIGMALWSRLSQRLVWDKLVGKLSALHPGEPQSQLSASALSGRRKALGSQGLQALLHEGCRVRARPQTMPGAFFGRYRLMAIDGTVFNTADTQANEAAFGRSSNHYGQGAYPQGRCGLLSQLGSRAVVELEISRYDVSEVHGAHRLLDELR